MAVILAPKLNVDRRLRQLRGRVIVPNHPSVVDPILLFCALPPGTWFAATEKMALRYPVLRLLRALPVYWLPADGLRKQDFAALIEIARKGSNLVIFPQADVVVPGGPFACFPGFWRIARKVERKLALVSVEGTHAIMDWENERKIGRGKPVVLALHREMDPPPTEAEAVEAFRQMLAALNYLPTNAESPSGSEGPATKEG